MNYLNFLNQLKDIFFQSLIVFPILYFTNQYVPIFLLSVSIDSIFSAFNFIKNFLLLNTSKQELLTSSDSLYSLTLVNRYIYYIILEIQYKLICNLFWTDNIYPLYYLLLISDSPIILNFIYREYLVNFYNKLDEEKYKFLKIIVCKHLSSIINTLSEICVDLKADINHSELLFLFDDYNKTLDNFLSFIKNFLIISFIHYTRKRSNVVYSKLIAYFYNYKTGQLIESIDLNTAKNRFREVIKGRKWEQLLNSDILQSIIYIYSLQEDAKFDYISIITTKFNYTIIKMFTIWTISSFFNKIYLAPLISLFLYIYRKPIRIIFDKSQITKYIFRFIPLILYGMNILARNYYINYILSLHAFVSFLCEFGYILCFNKITNSIVNYLYTKIKNIINISTHFNKYNLYLISIFIYIEILKLAEQNYYIFYQTELFIINFIFFILNVSNIYKALIAFQILIFGSLSNYYYKHILFILFTNYLIINIQNYYKNNKQIIVSYSSKKMDNAKIIESYYSSNSKNTGESLRIISVRTPKISDHDDDIKSGKNIKIYDKKVLDNYEYTDSYRKNKNN